MFGMNRSGDRSVEEVNLLNAAFCSVVMSQAATGYTEVVPAGMPFVCAFLVLPTALHKGTRDALPRTTRTSLAAWINENFEFRISFPGRVEALIPFAREGILFSIHHGQVVLTDSGLLLPGRKPTSLDRFLTSATEEVRSCIQRGRFIGKWFASVGSLQTLLALWGVRP